ncbi:MAG: hypothetical protein A3J29_00525 [Acidobacteria bacterium RIFCSPLOWO2_12_FULL_67_14b]|nr:MAG: hypothetical protein A3J29_00525 [Acidobacteria bacterium RIFCSPLOWO2_12_FULL_67_14b]
MKATLAGAFLVALAACADLVQPTGDAHRGAPRPGDVFKDCAECPEMVVVPAGSFVMGSPASEAGRIGAEGPTHPVTIARPFAVDRYEVTFAEWDACVAGRGCNGYRPDDRGRDRGRRPVVWVSWDDARAYVAWLTRRTGKPYRLLTEAEWEYAARAGTTTPWSCGARERCLGSVAWHWYNQELRTQLVGGKAANAFGLFDMHGNVWEWVVDCWHDSYAGAPEDGSAWMAGGDCRQGIPRGGSWLSHPWDVRSAARGTVSTSYRDFFNGFRIARRLD